MKRVIYISFLLYNQYIYSYHEHFVLDFQEFSIFINNKYNYDNINNIIIFFILYI